MCIVRNNKECTQITIILCNYIHFGAPYTLYESMGNAKVGEAADCAAAALTLLLPHTCRCVQYLPTSSPRSFDYLALPRLTILFLLVTDERECEGRLPHPGPPLGDGE